MSTLETPGGIKWKEVFDSMKKPEVKDVLESIQKKEEGKLRAKGGKGKSFIMV